MIVRYLRPAAPAPVLRHAIGCFGLAVATIASGSPTRAEPQERATFSDFRYVGAPRPGDPTKAPPQHYLNPVLAGSTSDPSIVRVGADYYLAASSFTFWPGIPIYRSRDLVSWTRIGSAVSRRDQMPIERLGGWQGLYAPDLKWLDGIFYLTNTCYGCGGNYIMTATKAEGPWSRPTWLPFEGIDPSIFFDDDGRAYILNNGPPPGGPRWDGHRAIWLQEIDLKRLALTGPRTVLVDGGADTRTKPYWIEGPHLIKRDGRYVLICAFGGTRENHSEIAFRATALRGPYAARGEPILSQLGLDPRRPSPVVQAGHADLVQTPGGDWWAVFLASRPVGPNELDYTAGRETYLLPVKWRDGWPEILPPGTAVPSLPLRPRLAATAGTEPNGAGGPFAPAWRGPALESRWLTLGSSERQWWTVGGGTLRLSPLTTSLGDEGQPALVAIRQSDPYATASVTVRYGSAGGGAGLAAFADPEHYWAVLVAGTGNGGRELRLAGRADKKEAAAGRIVARIPLGGSETMPVRLRLSAQGAALRAFYAFGNGGAWRPLGGPQDGLTLAVSHAGGFTGTVIGPVVLGKTPG